MSLRSFGRCPHCHYAMEMIKTQGGLFICPICSCMFRHNLRKWQIALPLVLVATALVYCFCGNVGVKAAVVAASIVVALTKWMSDYRIVQHGTDISILPPRESIPESARKESKWFIILLSMLLAAIALFFVWIAYCYRQAD